MFGSGSFWKKEAFLRMAEFEEPFPIYLEIYLPTVVHHLGFRVRDFRQQDSLFGHFLTLSIGWKRRGDKAHGHCTRLSGCGALDAKTYP